MTHADLAALPPAAQQDEITRSKESLEKILKAPVRSFALPYGLGTSETTALVREAGFVSSCSSDPDVIMQPPDMFRLPRFAVWDWQRDVFARWLGGLFSL